MTKTGTIASLALCAALAWPCAGRAQQVTKLDRMNETQALELLQRAPDAQVFELGGKRATAREARAFLEHTRRDNETRLRRSALPPDPAGLAAANAELRAEKDRELAAQTAWTLQQAETLRRCEPSQANAVDLDRLGAEAGRLLARLDTATPEERERIGRDAAALAERLRRLGIVLPE
jgi:hypothetical protein